MTVFEEEKNAQKLCAFVSSLLLSEKKFKAMDVLVKQKLEERSCW